MGYRIRRLVNHCYEDNCRVDATHSVIAPDGGHYGDYCLEHATAKVDSLERYSQAVEYSMSKDRR
jgi:hypothetical protein